MDYLRLGKTSLRVSRLGFGAIPIQRLSERDAVRLIRASLDRGINFIDTARAYGVSEGYIGKAITGRREEVILATKSHAREREKLLTDLQTSLRELGTETVDLFQFHGVSSVSEYERVIGPGGALEGALQAKDAGVIQYIGITSHSLDVARLAVMSNLFESVMFPLNFIAREPGEALYPAAVQADMGFIVMKPLGGGMLGNVHLAIRYLMQFPQAVILVGFEHIEEVDQIMQFMVEPAMIGDDDLAAMERIRLELGDRFCRRCQYCQPCPQSVPITQLMIAESYWKRMPADRFISDYAEPIRQASEDCIECGECEKKCPYELPIRTMLREAISLYETEKVRLTAEHIGERDGSVA